MQPSENDSLWVLPGPEIHGRRSNTDGINKTDSNLKPSTEDDLFQPGDLVADRFEIRASIGRGGMGMVYRAFDRLRSESVAIKALQPGLLSNPEAIKQFQFEATIATRLSHPNIVNVSDCYTTEGTHALVMELLQGHTLRQEIQQRLSKGKAFESKQVIRLLGPVCEALAYAHEITIHRDLKPENIWVCEDETVKLMDFGLAKLLRQGTDPLSWQTLSQLRLGSPYYMAPEQFRDASHATAASDQFALGVIAYEMFSGALPIGLAKPLRILRPDLPYKLTDSIDRALSNDPEARFPSIRSFWEAFENGSHGKRSLRQLIDTKPVLRKALIFTAVLGACTGIIRWGTSYLSERADVITQNTSQAHRDLDQARIALRTLRDMIDLRKQRHTKATTSLEALQAQAAPDPTNVEFTLNRDLSLAQAEKAFTEADLSRRLVSPRLDSSQLPSIATETYQRLEEDIREFDFESLRITKKRFFEEVQRETQILKEIASLAEIRTVRSVLPPIDPSQSSTLPPDWKPFQDLQETHASGDRWDKAVSEESLKLDDLRGPFQKHFETLASRHRKAREDWTALFPNIGPPPIEFLGYPAAKAEAAVAFEKLGRYDRAIPLLEDALKTIAAWNDEVTSLHKRCESVWNQALAEGRAYENVIGMRFVRVDNHVSPPLDLFWSIWETRVMDFARFADAVEKGNVPRRTNYQLPDPRWKHPGFPVGPTYPVVFIERETAQAFAQWIAESFGIPYHNAVPTIEEWQHLLKQEPKWQRAPVKQGLFPDRNEFQRRKWSAEYTDPEIEPGDFIRPVGREQPSANGLYDLFGNVWEWTSELVSIDHQKVEALYGGGSFGQGGLGSVGPDDDETVMIGRTDAIGFRLRSFVSDLKMLNAAIHPLRSFQADAPALGQPQETKATSSKKSR